MLTGPHLSSHPAIDSERRVAIAVRLLLKVLQVQSRSATVVARDRSLICTLQLFDPACARPTTLNQGNLR